MVSNPILLRVSFKLGTQSCVVLHSTQFHFWHSRTTVTYGIRIGLVSTQLSTFLKTLAASWQYSCSVRTFCPRSLDITYLDSNPWFEIQHASRHTNLPVGFSPRWAKRIQWSASSSFK